MINYDKLREWFRSNTICSSHRLNMIESFTLMILFNHTCPRDPSTFSEGTWTLQTYIAVSPITCWEGTWIPRDGWFVEVSALNRHGAARRAKNPTTPTTMTIRDRRKIDGSKECLGRCKTVSLGFNGNVEDSPKLNMKHNVWKTIETKH